MKKLALIVFGALTFSTACENRGASATGSVIAIGKMPSIAIDSYNNIHLVYGSGDSLLYSYSSDYGKTFSHPCLIFALPKLMATAMRGPQLVATSGGLSVTACNKSGDIFSFVKNSSGKWMQSGRVNDIDTIAKENLMAVAAEGQNVFAVWLDLRDKHNRIYGSKSTDGGKTWSKNMMIYASPDTTVCECCKPSVQVMGSNIFVMFRNWLNGNRDLYLIQSSDGGSHFGQAQKLGTGSWALKGCPMDGGGLTIDQDGKPKTVWNRKGGIYACEAGMEEQKIGEGRSCTIESINGKNAYAWVEKGEIIVLSPNGAKKDLGKGELPIIKKMDTEQIICVWENDNKIYEANLPL